MMTDPAAPTTNESQLRQRTERVLQYGFRVSVVLIAIGVAVAALKQEAFPGTLGTPADLLPGLLDGEAASIVGLGILAMILTPFMATVVLAWTFQQQRDTRYAGISLLVLLILLGSLIASAL